MLPLLAVLASKLCRHVESLIVQALSHKDGKALGVNILEFSDERHTCPVRIAPSSLSSMLGPFCILVGAHSERFPARSHPRRQAKARFCLTGAAAVRAPDGDVLQRPELARDQC